MRTLYVSDLDGTLLRSDERLSDYTNEVINRLTAEGMIFSYATARSAITAKKVTKGLDAKIPIIVYNGAFILDNNTGEKLLSNFFDDSIKDVIDELLSAGINPIVYAFRDGKEKFSYMPELINEGTKKFTDSRRGDGRANPVNTYEELKSGDVFYMTCIDEPSVLEPFYNIYKDIYHCVYQRDFYTNEQWLEFLPKTASKANAIKQLKAHLNCDRVIAFGDGKNDIDMFEIADECYAVENANDDLKRIATAIIPSNDEDGVAKWLVENR